MNIIFMGTPDFAVSALSALIEKHNVMAVFTQPDKPKNRGKKLQMPPVKELALSHNIPTYQPLSLRRGEDAEKSLETIKALSPDCIVVAAYGQILPKSVLESAKYGCVNIHASLLPEYRGAAPIQQCIIDGKTFSGVTVMNMAEGLDTGDMLISERVEIPETMTAGELHDELAAVGAKLILKALDGIEAGTITPIPQDDAKSCYAGMISKEQCRIDFSLCADRVYNFIRGMSPAPCAYTFIGDRRLKVFFAEKTEITSDMPAGSVVNEKDFTVVCGDNKCIRLKDIQAQDGKRMDSSAFLRGCHIEKGFVLG